MTDLGARIKMARKSANLSQELLAEKVRQLTGSKFSQQNLNKLETGKLTRTSFIVSIAMSTGHNPQWIESGQGPSLDTRSSAVGREIPMLMPNQILGLYTKSKNHVRRKCLF